MNKSISIILIILLSILSILLIGGLVIGINSNYNFDNFIITDSYSNKLVEEKEISNIKDLNIEVDVADAKIEVQDSDSIKIELYSNNPKTYEINEENNMIKVVLKNKIRPFNFFNKGAVAKIYVPKNYSNNVIVNSGTGDIKIGDVNNANLEVKSDVGDVKVNSIFRGVINSRVGDIKIKKINELNIESKTGDVKVDQVDTINVKSNTGDIKIGTVNKLLKIKSKTGDVKIENANIKENSNISSDIGDVKIYKAIGCYVNGNTNVGDIKINNNDRKSNIELNINSRVGDIKVNY